MNTVTFCGHRYVPLGEKEAIRENLYGVLEELIGQGATLFLLGGYGEFDRICAETVKSLKTKYPHIKSVLVVPYIDRDYDKELYDCSEYPPIETVPKKIRHNQTKPIYGR